VRYVCQVFTNELPDALEPGTVYVVGEGGHVIRRANLPLRLGRGAADEPSS